jgi:pilus assembly protein CpaB
MARTLTAGPERTNRLLLIGAVALAALAAVLVFLSLSNFGGGSKDKAAFSGSTADVVVATRDIKAGTKITSDMLDLATLPVASLVEGAMTEKAGLVGLTARYPVLKNEQFSPAKLGQTEADKVFANVIPPGKRAVAIPVTENTNVAGLIVAGDRVDITAVTRGSNNGATASTVLQNVLVLAVGQTAAKATTRLDANGTPIPGDNAGDLASRPDNTDPNAKARTLTVAVDPNQVPVIALAQEQGTVYLSLRPPGDESTQPSAANPQTLPGQ